MKSNAIVYLLWDRNIDVLKTHLSRFPDTEVLYYSPYTSTNAELVRSTAGGRAIDIAALDRSRSDATVQRELSEAGASAAALSQAPSWHDWCAAEDGRALEFAETLQEYLVALTPEALNFVTALDAAHQLFNIKLVVLNDDVTPHGRLAALWARRNGIKSLLVQHGLLLSTAYTVHAGLHTDAAAVFGTRGIEAYQDIGVSLDRLAVTGNPAWDKYATLLPRKTQIKQELFKRHGLDVAQPTILFGTTWSANLTAHCDESLYGDTILAFLEVVKSLRARYPRLQAVVKDRVLDAGRDATRFEGYLEHAGLSRGDVTYVLSDTESWLLAADIVVSVDSNLAIEAILARTASVNLMNPTGLMLGPSFEAGKGVLEVDEEGLLPALSQLVENDSVRQGLVSQGEKSATTYNDPSVEGAAHRVATLIEQLGQFVPVSKGYVWQDYLDVEEIDATGYHGGARADLVAMFTNDPKIVLDIGCAAGGTGELIKQRFPQCKVWGIETNKSAAGHAAKRLDRVLVGKYEDFDLEKEGIAKGSLDGVILADVLEHMYNPWAVMTSLHAYLSTAAQVIISIPNVRNLKLMEDMAAGFWRYEPAGLLDITHIRFFTLKEFRRFLHETGYHMASFRYGIDQRLAGFFQASRERDMQDIELGRMRLKDVGKEELAELCSLQFYICARMGALNEDIRSYHAEDPYLQYLSRSRLTKAEGVAYDKLLDSWVDRPAFAMMVMAPGGGDANLTATIRSLTGQLYKDFVIWVVSPTQAPVELHLGDRIKWLTIDGPLAVGFSAVVEHSKAEWVCWMRAGDTLEPQALLRFAEAGSRELSWQMLYCDEDQIIQEGVSTNPVFKPDFDPYALMSSPYLESFVAIRRQALIDLGGVPLESDSAESVDLALKCWERWGEKSVGHLASVLLHTAKRPPEAVGQLILAAQSVANAALARFGVKGTLVPGWRPTSFRMKWDGPVGGMVSLLVPVRDNLTQLQRCVESLFEKSGHADIELLLLDTGSTDSETLAFLEGLDRLGDPRMRVFRHAEPHSLTTYFNLLARESRGVYLAFMHFDCVPLEMNWLDALLNEVNRPGVGLVAPRLLDGQGKVQGGGLILGINGGFAPAFGGMAHDDSGPLGRAHIAQCFSAVAGGFTLMRREHFFALDGFDPEAGAAAEVDLCLRLKASGLSTLWTPYVSMMVEGVAAALEWADGPDNKVAIQLTGDEAGRGAELMQEKWLPVLARDPAYNPGFSTRGLAFEPVHLSALMRAPLPWKPLPRILIEPADLMGCGNYRMIQPGEALGRAGIAETLFSSDLLFPSEYERLELDSIVLQRQMLDHQIQRLAQTRKFNRMFLVYELDDLITNLPARSLHRNEMPPDVASKLRAAVSLCDRFVVSTEPLAHAYRDLSSDMRVVPNRLDRSRWEHLVVTRVQGEKPRVGWAGGVSHTGDLDLIADVVKELADEVDWVFLGMCPERLRPYVKEFSPGVAVDKYPAKLASLGLDLAIAPLEINPFNECKSNLKLLEYGVLGYPVICTDTTPYQCDLPVRRIKNRHKDWVGAIREMLADRGALEAAGTALRAAVLKDWMLDDHLDSWLKAWLP